MRECTFLNCDFVTLWIRGFEFGCSHLPFVRYGIESGDNSNATLYADQAESLYAAMVKHMWNATNSSFCDGVSWLVVLVGWLVGWLVGCVGCMLVGWFAGCVLAQNWILSSV